MGLVLNPYAFAVSTAVVTGSIALTSTTDATSYNFNDVSSLNAHEQVVLGVTSAGGGNISGATVEGVSASLGSSASNGSQRASIYAVQSSVLTPDVVVNLASAPRNIAVTVIGATGIGDTATPVGAANSASNTPSLSANAMAGGLAVGCAIATNGGSQSWAGLSSEVYDANLEGTDNHSSAYQTVAATESPRSMSVTYSVPWVAAAASATYR